MSDWSGRRVMEARAIVATWLPAPCGRCHQTVNPNDRWVVGHIKPRATHPHLTWLVSNWQPEHKTCSDRTGQATVIEKAQHDALTAAGFVFPHGTDPRKPPHFPAHTYGVQREPMTIRDALLWANLDLEAAPWLQGVLEVPGDASPPLAMTPPHPEAVCSYGWEGCTHVPEGQAFEPWVASELGITLRWWQRLAGIRQLEHREDGSLCWRTIVESGPRRIGKSVRLRSMSLWRLAVGPGLFPEKQLALHTGKDVAIVREIHRQAWRWAQMRDGWDVKKGVGQEEVFTGDNRWLVRSTDSVYGYDVCLGMVDEAWAVSPATFDEGLEPATMERLSPQLLLTSTAHRRATSLMRKKVSNALAFEDGETLLLLWGARPEDDPADPETWKAASPHWSEDRRRMIAAKYEAALNGEVDPEADDPDPMEAFLAQYLNVWRLRQAAGRVKGDEVVAEAAWGALVALAPDETPHAVAMESWYADGVSVAFAWRSGEDTATVRVEDFPDVAQAAAAIRDIRFRGTIVVGASLADDPALTGLRITKGQGRVVAAVQELARLAGEGAVMHDGGEHLTGQVLGARTAPSADGPRLVSKGRGDAIKAAVWAVSEARKKGKMGKPRILLPTAS